MLAYDAVIVSMLHSAFAGCLHKNFVIFIYALMFVCELTRSTCRSVLANFDLTELYMRIQTAENSEKQKRFKAICFFFFLSSNKTRRNIFSAILPRNENVLLSASGKSDQQTANMKFEFGIRRSRERC